MCHIDQHKGEAHASMLWPAFEFNMRREAKTLVITFLDKFGGKGCKYCQAFILYIGAFFWSSFVAV